MKIPMLVRRKKLRTATARRSAGAAAEMDYAEIPEPNMKLSRALLIVLLLHVVAVSGIIAFNAIKTRQSSFVPAATANTENNLVATPGSTINAISSNPRPALAQKDSAPRDEPKTSHSPAKPFAKDDHAKPAERRKAPVASGKVYTVAKGDNPVTIAKKLKVSYDDLIALNRIEDPHKLKIGQRLLIPKSTKTKAKKKTE
jgi:LysM repeat protein